MFRAATKAALLILWLSLCMLIAIPLRHFSGPRKQERGMRMMQLCARGMLRIIGVKTVVCGEFTHRRPALLVTNHSSYLDVLVIAAHAPVRFTPKSEVGRWPVIGLMCRLTDCVFIDRRIHRTAENRKSLHDALQGGGAVCLFPEGTTDDGKRVLPFRSSYFSLAEQEFHGEPLTIQPAAITYTRVYGLRVDSALRPKLAWYGDMALAPHLMELLSLGPIEAYLAFGEPLHGAEKDRKTLAAQSHEKIVHMLQEAIR